MRPGRDYMVSEDDLNLQFYFFAGNCTKATFTHLSYLTGQYVVLFLSIRL
jgi:hypothetical protein